MSSLATAPRPADATPDQTGRAAYRASWSPLGRWRSSWALALRMARRDVVRHWGRSAVVLLMIALPVAAIVSGLGVLRGPSQEQLLPYSHGAAAAQLRGPSPSVQVTSPTVPELTIPLGGQAEPLPGLGGGDATVGETQRALQTVAHGRVTPWQQVETRAVVGDRRPRVQGVMADARLGLGSKARLRSGAWPTASDQIVVTKAGIAAGLPESGTLRLLAPHDHTVTVVGRADVYDDRGAMLDYLAAPALEQRASPDVTSTWLLIRDRPMTWSETQALWRYGIDPVSAAVVRQPPAASELPSELRMGGALPFDRVLDRTTALIVATVLFLVVALIVAPSFAVGGARRRRTLALLAGNGAPVPALRRSVIGQGVLLGGVGATIGATLGWFGARTMLDMARMVRPEIPVVAGTPPWQHVGTIAAAALLAAVAAAAAPALRLGRLDVVRVMGGQAVSAPLRPTVPLVGAACFGVGTVGVFSLLPGTTPRPYVLVACLLLLFLGAVLLTPAVLALAARLARPLPATTRIALRDTARQRNRSAPAVAAVMGAATLITVLGISAASADAKDRDMYQPTGLRGEGRVMLTPVPGQSSAEARTSTAAIHHAVPEALVVVESQVQGAGPAGARTSMVVMAPGCTPQEAFGLSRGAERMPECALAGTDGRLPVAVLPPEEIVRRLHLDGADARAVRGGTAVALHGWSTDDQLVKGGGLHLAQATGYDLNGAKPSTNNLRVTGTSVVPALEVPAPARHAQHPEPPFADSAPIAIPTGTAQRLGLATGTTSLSVHLPSGEITQDQEDRIQELLPSGEIHVERGYRSPLRLPLLVLSGLLALTAVVVTLTTTALSLTEQAAFHTTFAAVGATRATRRAMAASEAGLTALIGCLLGLCVGAVPGVALAIAMTAVNAPGQSILAEAVIEPAWELIAVAVVGIPLLAAAFAALAIRREPTVARRTA